jgi:hypothetical protein
MRRFEKIAEERRHHKIQEKIEVVVQQPEKIEVIPITRNSQRETKK